MPLIITIIIIVFLFVRKIINEVLSSIFFNIIAMIIPLYHYNNIYRMFFLCFVSFLLFCSVISTESCNYLFPVFAYIGVTNSFHNFCMTASPVSNYSIVPLSLVKTTLSL